MAFRLACVGGRAALVQDDHYFDLETLSGGAVGSDPMEALASPDRLHELSTTLEAAEPTGVVSETTLDDPVPRPRN